MQKKVNVFFKNKEIKEILNNYFDDQIIFTDDDFLTLADIEYGNYYDYINNDDEDDSSNEIYIFGEYYY